MQQRLTCHCSCALCAVGKNKSVCVLSARVPPPPPTRVVMRQRRGHFAHLGVDLQVGVPRIFQLDALRM